MSLRRAINAKCRDCSYDPKAVGSAAQQIAACVVTICPLHPVRPVTAKSLPLSLLEAYGIDPLQLDARARGLVPDSVDHPADPQIGRQWSRDSMFSLLTGHGGLEGS